MSFANKDLIVAKEFPGNGANSLVQRSGQFHDVYIGVTKVVSIAKTQSAASRLPNRALKLKTITDAVPAICVPEVLAVHEDCFDAAVIEQISVELALTDGVLQRMTTIRGTFALQQALADFEDNEHEALALGLREYI